jgi:hypothetical protein
VRRGAGRGAGRQLAPRRCPLRLPAPAPARPVRPPPPRARSGPRPRAPGQARAPARPVRPAPGRSRARVRPLRGRPERSVESARRSSASSSPTGTLGSCSLMPAAARSPGSRMWWLSEPGCWMRVSTLPRLTAGVSSRTAAGEGYGRLAPLELREGALEPRHRRVADPAVHGQARTDLARAEYVEARRLGTPVPGGVRRGQVQRYGVQAEVGQVLAPGVDGEGCQGFWP